MTSMEQERKKIYRVNLNGHQKRTATDGGYVNLTEAQALSVRGKATSRGAGGRAPVLRDCPRCGITLGARAMRAHRCPK